MNRSSSSFAAAVAGSKTEVLAFSGRSGRRRLRRRSTDQRHARHRTALVAFLGAIALAGVGCDRAPGAGDDEPTEPVVAFDTGNVRIETEADTFQLRVELAESPEQRAHGLMERDRLAQDAGMLFLFTSPQPPTSGFYMFRTRIPLDIAYIDDTGRIVSIRNMQPCDSPNPQLCRSYQAGVSYASALEVNAGYFAEHGIDVGDRVVRVGATEGESPSESAQPQ